MITQGSYTSIKKVHSTSPPETHFFNSPLRLPAPIIDVIFPIAAIEFAIFGPTRSANMSLAFRAKEYRVCILQSAARAKIFHRIWMRPCRSRRVVAVISFALGHR